MVKSGGKPKEVGDGKPPIDKKAISKRKTQQQPGDSSSGAIAGRKSAGGRNSVDDGGEKRKSTRAELPPLPPLVQKTESFKYLGMEPEWNSEEIRNHTIRSDGFTCCIVLVMEDSAELTAMGNYLHHAVKTGVRQRFISISGEEIAVKVKKFLTSTKAREPGKDDQAFWERMDIWAEAIKQLLIGVKAILATQQNSQEVELTGARSKDLVRHMEPLTFANTPPGPEDEEEEEMLPPPPVPPPTVSDKSTPPKTDGEDRHKKKKGKEEKKKSASLATKPPIVSASTANIGATGVSASKSRSANMRKRGELPMPTLEEIDDSPPNGPQAFVLLQGFYNPKILEELLKIGVPVDAILLMTDAKVTKRNFSVLDIEDSIPGAFRPRNILPNYLKRVEEQNTQPRAERDVVGQFWAGLADLYNTTRSDSQLLDCALMNFALPQTQFNLDSAEARGIYASKLFEEASQIIYEMVVLNDWFHDYSATTTLKQINPVEEEVPHVLYDELLNQVPAECVTIPLIMECILEQVIANTGDTSDKSTSATEESNEKKSQEEIRSQEETKAEHEKFGRPDWGNNGVPQGGLTALSKQDTSAKNEPSKPLGPVFTPPLYIKNGDFASIMACHLNETVAAHIASTQVAGILRNIQGLLWQNVPEFNKGLYMKLLGNLNHFMYFLPPESIRFEDMFFILHLLMSAGVEVQLQKQSKNANNKPKDQKGNPDSTEKPMVNSTRSQLLTTHSNPEDLDIVDKNISGTNLDKEHNYLAVNESVGLHFILAPNSNSDLTVAPVGHTKENGKSKDDANNEEETRVPDAELNPDGSTKRKSVTYEDEHSAKKKSLKDKKDSLKDDQSTKKNSLKEEQSAKKKSLIEDQATKKKSLKDETSTKRNSGIPGKSILNTDKAKKSADVATENVIKAAAELVNAPGVLTSIEEEDEEEEDLEIEEEDMEEHEHTKKREPDSLDTYYFGPDAKASKSKRFIACEQEWFKDLNDYSVFQSLLECPALLAISDSGALDLSTWIKTYLLSSGLTDGSGDGVLIGRLKDWNFVEELVPIQMIQLLNEAMGNYLSMQRMYCPFYDTLLFIFNNPTPKALKSDTQFYYKLKTLPGLQHFLEYTINDDNILPWLMGREKNVGAEIIDTLSLTTLMKIVPEEQWLLVPSIKFKLYQEQAKLAEQNVIANAAALPESPIEEEEQVTVEISEKRGSLKEGHTSSENDAPGSNPSAEENDIKGKRRSKGSKRKSRKSKELSSSPEEDEQKDVKTEEGKQEKRVSKTSADGTEKTKKKDKRQSKEKESPPLDPTIPSKNSGKRVSKDSTDLEAMEDLPNAIPSFHFNDAIANNRTSSLPEAKVSSENKVSGPHLDCYDLGKRVIVAAADTYHLFPMDGSIIQYDISTIEPEFRMMQLTVSKNGHQTFFYPYYIPHDLDLTAESYVVCPYFHMVHANGTMFAFQDRRATEAAPYMRVSKKNKEEADTIFSYEKVVFGSEADARRHHSRDGKNPEKNKRNSVLEEEHGDKTPMTTPSHNRTADTHHLGGGEDSMGEEEHDEEEMEEESGKKGKPTKGPKDKEKHKNKESKVKDKTSDVIKVKEDKSKHKGKDKKQKKGRKSQLATSDLNIEEEAKEIEEEALTDQPEVKTSKPQTNVETEWVYSDSENSEEENADGTKRKRNSYYAPNWDEAELTMEPMTHSLKITLPSGLLIQVDDVPGPPVTREVKQTYTARGSATSRLEASRYYTMNGSVVKFMLNGTIQILTARGVTTTIRELATSSQRGQSSVDEAFISAASVRIFNGDVILPNGDFWHIVDGRKEHHDPIFVFTSGPLANGEIFRRRQDGVVYLHRHDGTTITHYPDGTRFTTRMVVLKEPVEEFEDWVFVGLKYMVEHSNYSTVIFNTLSGNLHILLPQGIWTRVFADGSVKLSTIDNYTMDIDKNVAVLSFPPSPAGDVNIPNLTSVKLWHSKDQPQPPTATEPSVRTPKSNKSKAESEPSEDGVPKHNKLKANSESGAKKPKRTSESGEDGNILKQRTSTTKMKPSQANIEQGGARKPKRKSERNSILRKSIRDSASNPRKSFNSGGSKTLTVQGLDGELLEEEEGAHEHEDYFGAEEEDETHNDSISDKSKSSKKFEIQEFLQFTDSSLLCKAVDSWDNRFAVDIYGETIVDKGSLMDKNIDQSAEELLKSFAEHCELPQEYVSGILRMTSSDDLATAAKRITALKQLPAESTGQLSMTKMFVVKRDMSGYEYFKKGQVDKLMSRAKGCRDSMVIVDPLPNREPRKFITIMEPISEIDKPSGMWTNNYREPVFRPRVLTNKHLQISKFDDLRWFGYVLMSAHKKIPKFFSSIRDNYLKKKSSNEMAKQKAIDKQLAVEKEHEQEISPLEEVKPDKGKGKDKGKSKPPKKEKAKKSEKEQSNSKDVLQDGKLVKRRKSQPKKHGKSEGRKSAASLQQLEIVTDRIDSPEMEESHEEEPLRNPIRLDETEIGDYPEDKPDLAGIYQDEEPIKISPQHHADILTQKKAIVVRSFVEIPQVDEKLQRALLAASMSYGQTVQNQIAAFSVNSIQDPRSEEEKQRQKLIKQQLVEQNLSDMHLLEQRSGAVLRFHF